MISNQIGYGLTPNPCGIIPPLPSFRWQKPGWGSQVWVQSAPGHQLDEDRYEPVHGSVPQHWRWRPMYPARRSSFPRITQATSYYPAIILVGYWLLIFSFSGLFYQKTHSLYGRNALLFCLIVSCLSLTSDLHLLLRPGRGLWWQLFLIYYQWLSILFVFLT